MNQFAPIALFVYNRLWHTQQTINSLLENSLAKDSELIIFSDGAKNFSQNENVKEVREYIRSINGFKSIVIIEKEKNQGLANSIIDGVTQVVNEYGKIIVLEDDLVLSRYFLEYMNNALTLYENVEEVISIHGYCYPIKVGLPETFFLKGADCWGWATWKRGWVLFEKDSEKLLHEIVYNNLEKEFDFNSSMNYVKMLKNQIKGEIDSWAIRWNASAFLRGKLTLYPGVSLVNNIGSDNSGTHIEATNKYFVKISERQITVQQIPIEESAVAKKAFEKYFKSIQPNLLRKLFTELKLIITK